MEGSVVGTVLTVNMILDPFTSLGIDTIDMTHHAPQVRLRRLNQQVVVIAHQAITQNLDAESLMRFAQGLQERFKVVTIGENLLPRSSTVHYMVVRVLVFYSQGSWHGGSVVGIALPVNMTLDPSILTR